MDKTYTRSDIKISDVFYNKMMKHWLSSPEKDNLIHPDEARHSPAFVMSELLLTILDTLYTDPNLANAAFADVYPVALRGDNPFDKRQIVKAKINIDYFNYVLREI